MAGKFGLEDAMKLNGGGGKFFKVNPDDSKVVRFLWDNWDEVDNWTYRVHEIRNVSSDGQASFSTVYCPKQDEPDAICKYCEGLDGMKNEAVGRVIIPVYVESEGKIQYWKRSASWVVKTLKPVLEEYFNLPSLAAVKFKIKRTGQKLDTNYLPIAMGGADDKMKTSFGELENPLEVGLIKKYGESNNQQAAPQQQAPVTNLSPRRTTEMF